MKKSTVLIVAITFVLSVVIVGVFGMKMMSYNTRIYVESIAPTSAHTNTPQRNFNIREDEKKKGEYTLILLYRKDMIVQLVEIEGLNVHIIKELEAGDSLAVRLNYRSTDGNGASFTIYLYVLTDELYYGMGER